MKGDWGETSLFGIKYPKKYFNSYNKDTYFYKESMLLPLICINTRDQQVWFYFNIKAQILKFKNIKNKKSRFKRMFIQAKFT